MNNCPTFVTVNNERYDINTDFRYALQCIKIAEDENIGDFERAMAILYTLFGDKAFKCEKKDILLKLAMKYLACGQKVEDTKDKPDMDFIEDYDLIETSFMSDYHIDISKAKMHWWKFYNRINGLSNSELGNCCVLNNIRNLRNFDLSKVKDQKEREKIRKAKERFALKKDKKENHLTKEQEESMRKLDELLGL